MVDVRVLRREQLHRLLADQAAERRVTGIVHPRDTAGHRGLLVTARAEGEHDPKALPWPLSSAKPYFAILPCFFRKSEAFRVSTLEPGAAGFFLDFMVLTIIVNYICLYYGYLFILRLKSKIAYDSLRRRQIELANQEEAKRA